MLTRTMTLDPYAVKRLLHYLKRAVWLILAASFGTMVGRLILLAQQ